MKGIYSIVHSPTQRCYVGQSIDCEKRLVTHRRKLELGTHVNVHLQRCWNRDGPEAFGFELLVDVEHPEIRNKLEERLISILGHFNLQAGGDSKAQAPETREKQSIAASKRWASRTPDDILAQQQAAAPRLAAQYVKEKARKAAKWASMSPKQLAARAEYMRNYREARKSGS